MLIFGGGNVETATFHGNIAILDTHTWRWSIPNIQVSSCRHDLHTMQAQNSTAVACAMPTYHCQIDCVACSWSLCSLGSQCSPFCYYLQQAGRCPAGCSKAKCEVGPYDGIASARGEAAICVYARWTDMGR